MLVDKPCNCILKWLKLETPSSQKTSYKTHKFCVVTATFLATGGFVKLFHKISWFFHDYSVFFPWFHDFFHAWNFFCDFSWFPELVGTLLTNNESCLCNKYIVHHLMDRPILFFLKKIRKLVRWIRFISVTWHFCSWMPAYKCFTQQTCIVT